MLAIKHERVKRGWSQTRLSALTGIAQSDLSAIENERRVPGIGWRRKLSDVFGVSEADLFRRVAPAGIAATVVLNGQAPIGKAQQTVEVLIRQLAPLSLNQRIAVIQILGDFYCLQCGTEQPPGDCQCRTRAR